ncbi:hypothetical protein [Telmatospirillum sp. J64-1]|uniref:NifB/NifX family molybdenum-iron cluster-binding protein n=1 Tax=Telmatospirillum sp. J64-1 TaxID=2502183 RepID=UPI00115D7FF5|nr:hypothetical protein [Telmatospirillum sp. J64-1]
MKIAVAVGADWNRTAGHAGQCRRWLVFLAQPDSPPTEATRVELPKELVFHHFKDDRPHPLGDVAVVIAASAGESFKRRMEKRGIEAALTAESDPAKAAADWLAHRLAPPKPRPVGELLCKVRDLFSDHR